MHGRKYSSILSAMQILLVYSLIVIPMDRRHRKDSIAIVKRGVEREKEMCRRQAVWGGGGAVRGAAMAGLGSISAGRH